MNSRKSLTIVMAGLLIALILPAAALAQPAVSVECAYDNPTSTDLICQVWVDAQGETLRSAGVSVNYNSSYLTYVSATKDPAWMLTEPGAPAGGYPYDHWLDTGTAGQIIMVVGYLDTANIPAGITNRAKVADITFTRSETPAAGNNGAAQAAFFGISAALGRPTPFVNFVNTAGANLDDTDTPSFTAIAAERGDADASGDINAGDYDLVYQMFLGILTPKIYADCIADGDVNAGDYDCVYQKFLGIP